MRKLAKAGRGFYRRFFSTAFSPIRAEASRDVLQFRRHFHPERSVSERFDDYRIVALGLDIERPPEVLSLRARFNRPELPLPRGSALHDVGRQMDDEALVSARGDSNRGPCRKMPGTGALPPALKK